MGQGVGGLLGCVGKRPENDLRPGFLQCLDFVLACRGERQLAVESPMPQVFGQRQIQFLRAHRTDDPARLSERKLLVQLRVPHVAIENGDPSRAPAHQRRRIEIDADQRFLPPQQAFRQSPPIIAQAHQDHIDRRRVRIRIDGVLAIGISPLEDAQRSREELIQRPRIENHVCGGKDRDHADESDQAHGFRRDMAERQPQSRDDQRKLADLRHRQAGQETGPAAVAHGAHDRHYDQRIAYQHKDGKHGGFAQLFPDGRPIQPRAQIDEKKQQQKIAQTGQPRADRIAVACRGQRHTGQKRPHFLAESQPFARRAEEHRPGDGEQGQHLLRIRQPTRHPGKDVFHQHGDDGQQSQSLGRNFERRRPGRIAACDRRSESRERHQRQDRRDVLHNQESQGDLSMQRIDLLFIRKQLDDDDRARKRERHRHVGCGNRLHAVCGGDNIADRGSEYDLAQPGGQRHGAGRADQRQIEFKTDDEQQQSDADLGQQFDLPIAGDDPQAGRPSQNARGQKHDQQRLTQFLADRSKRCR
ncbi:MAG: hypothetical protein BWZ10_01494 [candidate division BRC1 bacterium ADurb.BinA364]|nr:MAG: hypothetical protein BWZ10_01494 [candidate division BRC1 bacterium ADurb.BinA364]